MPMSLFGVAAISPGDEEAVEEATTAGAAGPQSSGASSRLRRADSVAPVAVARAGGVADEVVARQHAAREVGMVDDAGVDDGDGHARPIPAAASQAAAR